MYVKLISRKSYILQSSFFTILQLSYYFKHFLKFGTSKGCSTTNFLQQKLQFVYNFDAK